MGNVFGWPHLLIILAVIVLLFGAAKLPALAKSLGQSARVFKGEMKAMKDDDKTAGAAEASTVDNAAATPAPAQTPASSTPADPAPGAPDAKS